jgi:hypothetical protein
VGILASGCVQNITTTLMKHYSAKSSAQVPVQHLHFERSCSRHTCRLPSARYPRRIQQLNMFESIWFICTTRSIVLVPVWEATTRVKVAIIDCSFYHSYAMQSKAMQQHPYYRPTRIRNCVVVVAPMVVWRSTHAPHHRTPIVGSMYKIL